MDSIVLFFRNQNHGRELELSAIPNFIALHMMNTSAKNLSA